MERTRLAKPQEVADHIGSTVANLAKWRHLGEGPPYRRVGRLIRYKWDDVEAWLDARTVAATK